MKFPVLFGWGIAVTMAHGSSSGFERKPPGLNWQSWHMIEEHHITEFDTDLFFHLHDLKGKRSWGRSDILNLYGLARGEVVGDGLGMGEHSHEQETVSEADKDRVVSTVMALMDSNNDGEISLDEWRTFTASGKELPDFGYGQGHHLDFEREYEEHHWKQYHANDDPDVLIKHAEDIEHELLHHEHLIEETHGNLPEIRALAQKHLFKVKKHCIPPKYRVK